MKIGGCFEVEIWLFFNFWLPKTASVLAELSWTHSTNSLTNNSSENYRPISSQLPFHNSITSQSNPFVCPFVHSSQQPVLFTAHAGFVRLLRTPVRLFASHAGSLVCLSVRLFVCSSVRRTNSTRQFYHQIIKQNWIYKSYKLPPASSNQVFWFWFCLFSLIL